ncbi:ribonuclease H [Brevundimonas phage vB_BpoS-Papperlapapp]|uniref:Ribonuclease H-like protein n=1 Tax=Brevundimonas phage vB_BpoS-Domovoi TaxID=2948598 RepID=A0A9E7MRW1_9CAUD|nr:ribonuclease H-like protein [Brevundimonas phage vB_BpoS-Domovoi]USN15789.1 ribonuclease H [Brevundimonas phage vB_BpoS-Papperlapapp]
MNYFLDCEFDGFGGDLLSLALVRQDGRALYIILERAYQPCTPWVEENVKPLMGSIPATQTIWDHLTPANAARTIAAFLLGDERPHIISDWPDDIAYFCRALMTGPGEMISKRHLTFEMIRAQAYPTTLEGAVQHNAYWDAMALRHLFTDD